MLVIKDLTKTYSSGVQALLGVSLDLPAGVFGLLGPNGSGKTTLMKIVATLLEPDSGTIEMNGADLITRKDHARRLADARLPGEAQGRHKQERATRFDRCAAR